MLERKIPAHRAPASHPTLVTCNGATVSKYKLRKRSFFRLRSQTIAVEKFLPFLFLVRSQDATEGVPLWLFFFYFFIRCTDSWYTVLNEYITFCIQSVLFSGIRRLSRTAITRRLRIRRAYVKPSLFGHLLGNVISVRKYCWVGSKNG